ncbi:VOC family protein [Alteromonas pelagimontana]|uniref:VOC family protein n=1 Tax=Alteromonas pelagimontana TaxID=1858656 RepID=A0A6M4MHV5_9ALTE|nr:VOC family protein [Alteromonas pelagimontana]QJR82210.1 VOC family protein [Alteromonas pelagimontana]
MLNNPIAWFEIYVEDMARAKAFYQAVLRVTLEQLSDPTDEQLEMWAFPSQMDQYGAGGSLVKMEHYPPGGNSTIIYFSCEDCAIEESRVAAAGGSVTRAKMSIGEYGFISLITDTEGNTIGLHSMA